MIERIAGSFRDPSGFVYKHNTLLLRQINQTYKKDYDHLMESGLYSNLIDADLLVSHREVSLIWRGTQDAYKVIQPQLIPFVSYPYEWCFSQLRDAALLMCEVQKRALKFGMTLKDASAYNVQFINGRPCMIDTLSFEIYENGTPWIAYRQFCQHFLVPLALMSYCHISLGQLLRVSLDGIHLDLAIKLLPWRCRTNLGLLLHIYLHGANRNKSRVEKLDRNIQQSRRISLMGLNNVVDHLISTINRLHWNPKHTKWSDYYETEKSYSEEAFRSKKELIFELLGEISIPPATVWDIGSNTGEFSQIISNAIPQSITIAWDSDPGCVEISYAKCVNGEYKRILPLLLDLSNPSPGIGWQHTERLSLQARANADLVVALALIHHLAITNNLSFSLISEFLSTLCRWLIIEFVPTEDKQVQKMLSRRQKPIETYSQFEFETQFQKYFEIVARKSITDSNRILYLMTRSQEVLLA